MKHAMILVALLALAGCKEDRSGNAQRVLQKQARDDQREQPICMPCVGPHLDLQSGAFRLGFSSGPGVSFQ